MFPMVIEYTFARCKLPFALESRLTQLLLMCCISIVAD